MKNTFKKLIYFVGCIFFLSQTLQAQNPEPVYSIVRQVKDFAWYEEQAKAWDGVIKKDIENPAAWVNFYTANRMARMSDRKKWKENQGSYFQDLDKIAADAQKAIPKTFESYFIMSYNLGQFSDSGSYYLLKAHELKPYSPKILDGLMTHFQFIQDKDNFQLAAKKSFESNEIPNGILNFNYNILMSLEKNAIVITNGDNDTYPMWVLQFGLGIRPDVLVINASMIQHDKYRDLLFANNSIPPLKLDTVNYNESQVTDFIVNNSNARPVYMSITLEQRYYETIKNSVYMVGLAFKYSKSDFDNMAVLRKNFENDFLLDYLKVTFENDFSQSVVNQLNLNYFAVFYKLWEHYKLSGEIQKADKILDLAKQLAKKGGNPDIIEYYFSEKMD